MVHDGTYKLVERTAPGGTTHELYRIDGFVDGDDLFAAPLSKDAEAAYHALIPELP
jgi:hypothetical protein